MFYLIQLKKHQIAKYHIFILYSRNLSLSSKYSFGRPCNTTVDRAQTLESEIKAEVIKVYLEETSKPLKLLSRETSQSSMPWLEILFSFTYKISLHTLALHETLKLLNLNEHLSVHYPRPCWPILKRKYEKTVFPDLVAQICAGTIHTMKCSKEIRILDLKHLISMISEKKNAIIFM